VGLKGNGHSSMLHSLNNVFAQRQLSLPCKAHNVLFHTSNTYIADSQVCCQCLGRICLHNLLGGEIRPDKNPALHITRAFHRSWPNLSTQPITRTQRNPSHELNATHHTNSTQPTHIQFTRAQLNLTEAIATQVILPKH
jgi:hypothetical protein